MKKVIFALIIVFVCSLNLFSAPIDNFTVTRTGGELNGVWPFRWVGYDKVVSSGSNRTMDCSGSGVNTCTLPLTGGGNTYPTEMYNDAVNYADLKVSEENILNGTHTTNKTISNVTYTSTITWSTNSSTGVTTMNLSVTTVE